MGRPLAMVRAKQGRASKAQGEVVVVPVQRGLARVAKVLGRRLSAGLQRRARSVGYRGGEGESVSAESDDRAIVAVGVGDSPGRSAWLRFGARARREADARRARRLTVFLPGALGARELGAITEGVHLAGYRFDVHRHPERPSRLANVLLLGPSIEVERDLPRTLDAAATVAECVYEARDLVNQPPSVATPSHLAAYARSIARSVPDVTVQVWDESRMRREGMAGVLAVARGTKEPPRLIVMRHRPKDATRHVVLVGKGITFDSGGLSLKPPKSMETMKYDMAGGAAVLATVAAVSRLAMPVQVTGIVPATENLPGDGAQKPGDVIRYANDKTVEVLNTDAEGRLVLADGLVLACRERPDAIIDLATLTGAARIALGASYAAVLGNDQALIGALSCAGEGAGEHLWQLPLAEEYRDSLKSTVADLRNVGQSPEGGTIVAALFLQSFVDGVPWAHLDIAGPAFAERDWPECPRGGSGFGVRLLIEYLRGGATA